MNARWGGGRLLVLGHRGASAHATENTLDAFRRARADGADGVELDVMRCGSGEVVVFHDEDLARLAGRPERIDRLPWRELAEVELTGGGRIPLLSDVLEELADLLVNVELKASRVWSGTLLAPAVARIIDRMGAADRVLVSSFNPWALARFRAAAPGVRTGLLFHSEQALPLREGWAAAALRPFAMHPSKGLVTAERMAAWRRAGRAVHVWTVDKEADVQRLAALGVDALISNDPAGVRSVINSGIRGYNPPDSPQGS
jgi:glycerophosphoryl diester phosphodiesterase